MVAAMKIIHKVITWLLFVFIWNFAIMTVLLTTSGSGTCSNQTCFILHGKDLQLSCGNSYDWWKNGIYFCPSISNDHEEGVTSYQATGPELFLRNTQNDSNAVFTCGDVPDNITCGAPSQVVENNNCRNFLVKVRGELRTTLHTTAGKIESLNVSSLSSGQRDRFTIFLVLTFHPEPAIVPGEQFRQPRWFAQGSSFNLCINKSCQLTNNDEILKIDFLGNLVLAVDGQYGTNITLNLTELGWVANTHHVVLKYEVERQKRYASCPAAEDGSSSLETVGLAHLTLSDFPIAPTSTNVLPIMSYGPSLSAETASDISVTVDTTSATMPTTSATMPTTSATMPTTVSSTSQDPSTIKDQEAENLLIGLVSTSGAIFLTIVIVSIIALCSFAKRGFFNCKPTPQEGNGVGNVVNRGPVGGSSSVPVLDLSIDQRQPDRPQNGGSHRLSLSLHNTEDDIDLQDLGSGVSV